MYNSHHIFATIICVTLKKKLYNKYIHIYVCIYIYAYTRLMNTSVKTIIVAI